MSTTDEHTRKYSCLPKQPFPIAKLTFYTLRLHAACNSGVKKKKPRPRGGNGGEAKRSGGEQRAAKGGNGQGSAD